MALDVYLIASPVIDDDELSRYLKDIGASDWESNASNDVQRLIEINGRICYRSWIPGLNPNITQVRKSSDNYIKNIIKSGHGSVLEHAQLSFILRDVSIICLAELCRHRTGIAISQQSGRYVVPDPSMFPNPGLSKEVWDSFIKEAFKLYYDILYSGGDNYDDLPFSRKKELTSKARRVMPQGMYSHIGWSANIRSLRHIITLRTSKHAEIEIQNLFIKISNILKNKYPILFEDL